MNRSDAAPILYYHSVANNCLSVAPAAFRAQMMYLRDHDYRAVRVDELVDTLANGSRCEKKVGISFDDGFASTHEHVLPILREFGFRATCFVVPGYAGKTLWGNPATRRWSVEEKPGHIACPMMRWNQMAQMSEAGMEIASHTLSHRNLTDLSEVDARGEIWESKEYLEEKLAIPIRGFCYPRGRHNSALARLVQESGYDYACTTQHGYATPDFDAFELPRICGPASMSDFVFHLKRFPCNVFTKGVLKIARNLEKLQSAVRGTAAQSHREA